MVVNGDNDMLDVTCTKTRQQPWKHLDDLAARWGHYPAMIRCDHAYEFVNDTRFKAWCEKHQITLDPVEGYRHRMQGRVENAVNEVKSHSRIAIGHAGLPARFWSETSRMVAGIHTPTIIAAHQGVLQLCAPCRPNPYARLVQYLGLSEYQLVI